jgi:NodT family efflux transporter outer membrane factor (OMF) lipoprotein
MSRAAAMPRALALSAALLSGCAVGPRYSAPTPPAPGAPTFTAQAQAIASTEQPSPTWWKLYNDPAIDALVQEALAHNKSLLVAAGNLAQARGALALARSNLFPSTDLSAGAQYGVTQDQLLLNKLRGGGTPSPQTFYTAGLDASYEVDLFGRIRRTIQAAKADYQAQQAAEDVTRVTVAGETTRAYLNACAYAQDYAVARQSLDAAQQTLDVTLKQRRDGAASDFDVARARETVEQVRSTLPGYDGQRRIALFQLAVLTGKPPESISQAAAACLKPPTLTRVLPAGDIQSLFRRRPDVRQAERQLAANIARIGIAAANLYPTLSIGGSVASAASTPGGLAQQSSLTYGIGPLLSWSFPNILAAQAQIRQARGAASASYANFQAVVLQALQDTESALTTYGNELDRNSALAALKTQSQIAFALAQKRYQLGAISYLDLLTAQNDLINAASLLANSEQALASDQVTVFKALGGGWEQAPAVEPLPLDSDRPNAAASGGS